MERNEGNQDGWYVGFVTITEVVMCEERGAFFIFLKSRIPSISFLFYPGAYEMHKRYSTTIFVI